MRFHTRQFVDRLKRSSFPDNVSSVILFGSEAYGVPNLLSDMDIAVVADSPMRCEERAAIDEILENASPPSTIQLTFVVKCDESEFGRFDVRRDIFEKGVVIYEK